MPPKSKPTRPVEITPELIDTWVGAGHVTLAGIEVGLTEEDLGGGQLKPEAKERLVKGGKFTFPPPVPTA